MKRNAHAHFLFLFFVAIWILFSASFLFKGNVPFPTDYLVSFFAPWSSSYAMPVKNGAMPDVITQIFPWKHLTMTMWKGGELPLWNPYAFSGTPHLGNFQTAVFFPIQIVFFFLPEAIAWGIMVLLQPLLAGVFMYVFLRSEGRSGVSSVIASIAYGFSGFVVVWMAYATLSYATLFLPLALYAVNRLQGQRDGISFLLVVISITLSLVSGHFQTSIYVVGVVVLYILSVAIASRSIRQASLPFIGVILGILLAFPQILPTAQSYFGAVRSNTIVKSEVIPIVYLQTVVIPDFFGNPVTRNDWFGHYAEWASYIGIIPFFLAVSAFILVRRKKVLFFGGVAVISLLLAYDTPINALIYLLKIPILDNSAASRILAIFSFSMSVLSAYGLDILYDNRNEARRKHTVIVSLLVSISVWLLIAVTTPFLFLSAEHLSVAYRNSILPLVITVLYAVLLLSSLHKSRFVRGGSLLFLIVLTGFDMYRFASKWMPFSSVEYLYPETKALQYLSRSVSENGFRAFGNLGGEVGNMYRIPFIDGYDAMYQKRYGELVSGASRGRIEPQGRSVVSIDKYGIYTERLFSLLSVRYYAHKKSDGRFPWAYPHWEYPWYTQVFSDEHYEIYENAHALPRVRFVSSYIVGTDDEDTLMKVYDPSIDIAQTVVLEKEPSVRVSSGSASITDIRWKNTSVSFSVTSESPQIAVVSDAYAPGWKASIDGKDTEVYRAYYALRAVPVPAGSHTVVMWYDPIGFRIGVMVSGVSCIIIGGIAFYMLRKKRRNVI